MRTRNKNKSLACVPGPVRAWLVACVVMVGGCASEQRHPTTRPASMADRQDAALRDPMGYSPNMNSPETDISGGELHELNRGAMKRDIDHVFNP